MKIFFSIGLAAWLSLYHQGKIDKRDLQDLILGQMELNAMRAEVIAYETTHHGN